MAVRHVSPTRSHASSSALCAAASRRLRSPPPPQLSVAAPPQLSVAAPPQLSVAVPPPVPPPPQLSVMSALHRFSPDPDDVRRRALQAAAQTFAAPFVAVALAKSAEGAAEDGLPDEVSRLCAEAAASHRRIGDLIREADAPFCSARRRPPPQPRLPAAATDPGGDPNEAAIEHLARQLYLRRPRGNE
eukprot:TRINITY_DN29642_c0_g3_i2.p3 TRINITY_DN29642_c0_g3~~TRINITY_DN29642_c0_g3_i2.p3  ORF type:complete len:188 (+),score=83.88 TRINITY_DN29642_c0_g3_i2:40-603(+)